MSIQQYIKELIAKIPTLLKNELQRAPGELSAYISDNMRAGRNPTPRMARTDSDPRLYVNSGALLKAASVQNATGNISETKFSNGEIVITQGVDLGVIPYARIHEYGGQAGRGLKSTIPARPYLQPAIEQYQKDGDGFGALIDEIMQDIIERFK